MCIHKERVRDELEDEDEVELRSLERVYTERGVALLVCVCVLHIVRSTRACVCV